MNLDPKQLSNKTKRPAQIAPSLTADLEFAIINGETSLPSKSKFYQNKLVYVRGLRFKEQLEIAQIASNVSDPMIAYHSVLRVYKNCIEVEGIEFNSLLEEDFTTLSLWIVFLTNPEQGYTIDFKCKQCEHSNSHNITPAQIDLMDFELFEPVSVNTDIGSLLIAPITMEENLWQQQLTDLDEALILGKHIKSRDGQPLNDLQTRLDVFGALSARDVLEVRRTALKFKSGIKPLQFKCSKCNTEHSIVPSLDLLKGLP